MFQYAGFEHTADVIGQRSLFRPLEHDREPPVAALLESGVQRRLLAPALELLAHLGLALDALQGAVVNRDRVIEVAAVVDNSAEQRRRRRQPRVDLQRLAQRRLCLRVVTENVRGDARAEEQQRVGWIGREHRRKSRDALSASPAFNAAHAGSAAVCARTIGARRACDCENENQSREERCREHPTILEGNRRDAAGGRLTRTVRPGKTLQRREE